MKASSGTTVIEGCRLFDGTGAAACENQAIHFTDGVINYVGDRDGQPSFDPTQVKHISAEGMTVTPGLVEAHFHPTYFNVSELADLDIKYPVEYVTLLAAANA